MYTPEEIEKGLTSKDWTVRHDWARRTDYTPTPEQIERGLKDEDEDVREAWEKRVSDSALSGFLEGLLEIGRRQTQESPENSIWKNIKSRVLHKKQSLKAGS